jgi:hypothetical protein
MDHSKHVRLSDAELTPSNLEGATIYGPGDSKIGSVSHIHGAGTASRVVIDVGGFLGIGAKPVAVPDARSRLCNWEARRLKAAGHHVKLTRSGARLSTGAAVRCSRSNGARNASRSADSRAGSRLQDDPTARARGAA